MNNIKLYQNLPAKLTQLLDFFDASSDIIVVCDVELTICYVNTAFEKLSGYKAKEVIGKKYEVCNLRVKNEICECVNDSNELLNKIWKTLAKGKSFQMNTYNTKKNGKCYFLEKNIMPVTKEKNKGDLTHLIFLGKDTNDQLKTINKLLQNKKALDETQKLAKLGFYVFDIKNDSWTSSSELNHIFGIKENFQKNFNSWLTIIHPADKELMLKYFTEEVLTKRKKFDIEYRIIDLKKGKEKCVHGLGTLKFDENNEPIEMFGTIQDITERKNIFEKIITSEKALKEAQKISKIGNWELNLIKNALSFSDEIYHIFDAEPQTFGNSYEAFFEHVHPEDRVLLNNFFTDSVKNKKPYGPLEYRLIMKDGAIKYAEAKGNSEYDKNGAPIRSFGTIQDITEKKIYEVKLKESEDKFRSIFHSLTTGMIIVIDEQGKVLEWNEGTELSFGYLAEEMKNKPLSMFMPERFRVGHEKGLEIAVKNKGLKNNGVTFNLFGLRKNGDEFPIELTLGSWERNGHLFFSAIIIDISMRIETEKRLLLADTIIQDIGSIIFLTNKEGELIFCSPSMKTQTGYSAEEIMGNNWWSVSFINTNESEKRKKKLIKYANNKIRAGIENHQRKVKCKDGSIKWFEWHNSKDNLGNIISIGHDVTERIKVEQEVVKFSRAINQSPVSVVITDLEGNIEYVNPNFEQVTGYSKNEVFGKNPRIFKSGQTNEETYKTLWDTISSGKTWKGEFHNVKKDGTLFWESASIGPILNKKGEISSYLALKEDITEAKALEQRLKFTLENLENIVASRTIQLEQAKINLEISLEKEKELGELKSRFVSTASHQFRTPLTVINANIGLINMLTGTFENKLKERLDKVTIRIQSEVEKMTELMNDVLILGKINVGNINPVYKQTNLLSVAKHVCSNLNNIQPDNRKVKHVIIGKPFDLMMDERLMEHTLSNIISNAFKYSVGCPSPLLTISYIQKQVLITIKDFGIGIPFDDLKNLFQTFYRASNVLDLPGTGLGIAIAKEYTELNGGKISVTTEINKGTEFTLVFNTNNNGANTNS